MRREVRWLVWAGLLLAAVAPTCHRPARTLAVAEIEPWTQAEGLVIAEEVQALLAAARPGDQVVHRRLEAGLGDVAVDELAALLPADSSPLVVIVGTGLETLGAEPLLALPPAARVMVLGPEVPAAVTQLSADGLRDVRVVSWRRRDRALHALRRQVHRRAPVPGPWTAPMLLLLGLGWSAGSLAQRARRRQALRVYVQRPHGGNADLDPAWAAGRPIADGEELSLPWGLRVARRSDVLYLVEPDRGRPRRLLSPDGAPFEYAAEGEDQAWVWVLPGEAE